MSLLSRSHLKHLSPSHVPSWVLSNIDASYLQFALITLLVYDTMIMLDKEVKYFWTATPAASTVVYFLNRYTGILAVVAQVFWLSYNESVMLCNFAEWTRNICNWATIILIDYILMVRVLALYSNDKKLSIFVKVLLVLEATFKLVLLMYITIIMKVSVISLAEDTTSCTSLGHIPVRWGVLDWLVPMVYAIILMLFVVHKVVQYWRTSEKLNGYELLKVVIRDQLIYFVLVISCCILKMSQYNIIIKSNATLTYIVDALGSPSFLSLMGSRLLMNLKQAGELGLNGGRSHQETLSEIQFS